MPDDRDTWHLVLAGLNEAAVREHGTADFAALDRFKKVIAASFLDQLDRCANWGFGIGDQLAPDQAGAAGGERRRGCRGRSDAR